MYEKYPKAVQETLKFHSIRNALENLCSDFEDLTDRELYEVTQGVYVICLSDPFTVQYKLGVSNVIYVGRGVISSRLKSHFERSLFDVMMSLAGASFDFYLAEPVDRNEVGYFKQLEHDLLANFREKIGGGSYPLLNKYAGSNMRLKLGAGWNRPLKISGKRPTWAIKPTGKRPIRELT